MELTLAKWLAYRVHETSNHEKGSETAARFFSYFHTYVEDFAGLAEPITGLTKKVCPIMSCGQPHTKKPLKP